MTKLRRHILFFVFVLLNFGFTQTILAQKNYSLQLKGVDKDSAYLTDKVGIQTNFSSQIACMEYMNKLPAYLQSKGYVTVSIDSLKYDSTSALLVLFLGEAYKWIELRTSANNPDILQAFGLKENTFQAKPVDFLQLQNLQQKALDWMENNGYPFGKIFLDSFQLSADKASAILKIETGPQYKIDSVRILGDAKVSKNFIQRYLDIADGTLYSKQKLQTVSKKIRDLPYVEEEKPSDLSMFPTGSVLNLYLKQKRSSQVNVLIGFLPNSDQFSSKRLLVTGEGNLNLKNALGSGETIGLSFQKLQVRSQRLNLFYQHPYLFHSPVGLDFAFDMYKRDSIFLNIDLRFGANYSLSTNKTGKLYFQRFQTIANGINTAYVITYHRLPDEADLISFNLGIDYSINNTDYVRNPRRGNEIFVSTIVGSKKIKQNEQVLQLKDPGDPSFDFARLYDTVKLKNYQLRMRASAAKYLPVSKLSSVKFAVNGGFFQSGKVFRNELFQIGGFRLLRGFDEESQYLSQFAIGTVEYHYFINLNSYFYALVDGGWGRNNSQNNNIQHGYISAGLGLAFETKVGIFNLAWAVGKQDDLPFNLRKSKIHFGFINYF
ncbi:MAG: hypothetical protein C4308_10490 [Chitinophagaceae bacterium]